MGKNKDVGKRIGDGRVVGDGDLSVNRAHDIRHDVAVLPASEHNSAEGEYAGRQIRFAATDGEGGVELPGVSGAPGGFLRAMPSGSASFHCRPGAAQVLREPAAEQPSPRSFFGLL